MDTVSDAAPRQPRRRWLRIALLLVPGVVFIALLVGAVMNTAEPPAPGDPAPSFRSELLSGEGQLSLEELRGKPILLNFWASWCDPCKEEAPMLREAHQRYGDEVVFVGVDIRDARSDAVRFAEKHQLDYVHVRDEDGTISDSFGLTGQPETFFIDEEGEILEHVPGPLFRDSLFQLLDALVARAA